MLQGQRGVARAIADETRAGGTYSGAEVTVRTASGTRRVDVVMRGPDGKPYGVEVKTGQSAYTPAQRAKDQALEGQGGQAVGKRAEEAGVAGEIRMPTKVIRYP